MTTIDATDPPCPGAGKCHGPRQWCRACGDVGQVCDVRVRGDLTGERCDCHGVPRPMQDLRALRRKAEARVQAAREALAEGERDLQALVDEMRTRRIYDDEAVHAVVADGKPHKVIDILLAVLQADNRPGVALPQIRAALAAIGAVKVDGVGERWALPVEKPARRPLPKPWGWFDVPGSEGVIARSPEGAMSGAAIAAVEDGFVFIWEAESDIRETCKIPFSPGDDPRAIAEDECWKRKLFGEQPSEEPEPAPDPRVVDGHCSGECGKLASECSCAEEPEPIEPGDRFREIVHDRAWRAESETVAGSWCIVGVGGVRYESTERLLNPALFERLPREPRPVDAAPSELTAMPLRTGGIDPDAARAAMPELQRRLAEPEPLTEDELAAIEARCEAATPGPLIAVQPRSQDGGMALAHCGPSWSREAPAFPTATSVRLASGDPSATLTWQQHAANAAFFANARSDVPRLVAEVRRLREERDAATEEAGRQSLLYRGAIARAEKAEAIAATWERQFQDLDTQARRDRVTLRSAALASDANANRARAALSDLFARLVDRGMGEAAEMARKAIADAAALEPDPTLPAGWRWEGRRIGGNDETPLCLYQRIEDRGDRCVARVLEDGAWEVFFAAGDWGPLARGRAIPRSGETARDAGKRAALLALRRAGKLGA